MQVRFNVGVMLVVAALTAACGGSPAPAEGSAGDDTDPGIVHVHGLDVEPASETLYVATHTGLFTVTDDGSAQRVGDYHHDLMGFTIAGENDFIASGHPDLRASDLQEPGKPPLLGLIESVDGRSWTPRSLLGDVDFHSLEAAHGKVYGLDSTTGTFMVSDDRENWQNQSTVALHDFVVSPADPNVVLGADDQGVSRSSDQGRSWEHVASEPIVLLEWGDHGPLAVTETGAVLTADEQGDDWQAVGSLEGPPQAFEAEAGTLYAAVEGQGVLRSTDAGASWEVALRP